MWFQLATRLHTPVQRLMRETTSREFVKWCKILNDEMNKPERGDYYLAALTAEVRRSWVKDPSKVDTKDFIIQFEEVKPKDEPPSEEVLEQRITKSKAAWFGAAGLKTRKPPPQKKKGKTNDGSAGT